MAAGLTPSIALGDSPNIRSGQLTTLLYNGQSVDTFVGPSQREPSAPLATITVQYDAEFNQNQAARDAFQRAVDIWSAQIASPVPIVVVAEWNPLPITPQGAVLGSAGPATFVRNWQNGNPPPIANTWYPIGLANKLAGQDLIPPGSGTAQTPDYDIFAQFNKDFTDWYFGIDGNTPADKVDFVSTVLHELGHGLGFSGSARVQGNQGEWGLGSGTPFVYDRLIQTGSGNYIIDTNIYGNPSPELGGVLQSDSLFFVGNNAIGANGGTAPKIYAPTTWIQGSSYAHWDEDTYMPGNPNSLMTPQIASGEAIHDPGPLTRAMFVDLGWSLEPTAVTLAQSDATPTGGFPLLAGLMGVTLLGGAALWRMRRG